jgi:hypothetical protein
MLLRRTIWTILGIAVVAMLAPGRCSAETEFLQVRIDTAGLINHAAGPFTLAFVLTDGSGIANGNSRVVVSNVTFGSGRALGSPESFGSSIGDLDTSITMTNNSYVNMFAESFSPGKEISFNLYITSARPGIDARPSRLTLFILDRSGTALATLAPVGNYFFGVELIPESSKIDSFGSNPAVPPYTGPAVSIPAPRFDD